MSVERIFFQQLASWRLNFATTCPWLTSCHSRSARAWVTLEISDTKDLRHHGKSWDGEQVGVEFVQIVATRGRDFQIAANNFLAPTSSPKSLYELSHVINIHERLYSFKYSIHVLDCMIILFHLLVCDTKVNSYPPSSSIHLPTTIPCFLFSHVLPANPLSISTPATLL